MRKTTGIALAALAFAITPPLGAANAAEPSPSEQPPSAQGDQPAPSPTSDAPSAPSTATTRSSPRAAGSKVRKRLRCRKWSFTPPTKTVCRKAVKDRIRTKRKGSDYLAYSRSKRRWVAIPYSWTPAAGYSSSTQASVTSLNRRVVRIVSGATRAPSGSCGRGRPSARPVARSASPPNSSDRTQTRIYSSASKKYVASPYRWRTRGGYLVLDARLIPAPKPVPSASITFRSALDSQLESGHHRLHRAMR